MRYDVCSGGDGAKVWQIFCAHGAAQKPLFTHPIVIKDLANASLHYLQRKRKQLKDEKLTWTRLSETCRSNFELARSFRLKSVDELFSGVVMVISEKMWERTSALRTEDIIFGLCRLNGFDRALQNVLQKHFLMDATDSESSSDEMSDASGSELSSAEMSVDSDVDESL